MHEEYIQWFFLLAISLPTLAWAVGRFLYHLFFEDEEKDQ